MFFNICGFYGYMYNVTSYSLFLHAQQQTRHHEDDDDDRSMLYDMKESAQLLLRKYGEMVCVIYYGVCGVCKGISPYNMFSATSRCIICS